MSDVKKLTALEFHKLELVSAKRELLEKDMEINKAKVKLHALQKLISNYQVQDLNRAISGLENGITTLQDKKKNLSGQRDEIIMPIKKRLKIKGPLSYNDETMEVVTD